MPKTLIIDIICSYPADRLDCLNFWCTKYAPKLRPKNERVTYSNSIVICLKWITPTMIGTEDLITRSLSFFRFRIVYLYFAPLFIGCFMFGMHRLHLAQVSHMPRKTARHMRFEMQQYVWHSYCAKSLYSISTQYWLTKMSFVLIVCCIEQKNIHSIQCRRGCFIRILMCELCHDKHKYTLEGRLK